MAKLKEIMIGANLQGMVKQALARGSENTPAGTIAHKIAQCAEYDAAVAYDVGFLKRAKDLGLSETEAQSMYDLARRKLQAG